MELYNQAETHENSAINYRRFLIALALAFVLAPFEYPAWFAGLLHRLGDTLASLALVSVGLQLQLDQLRGN
jgi:predicted permease